MAWRRFRTSRSRSVRKQAFRTVMKRQWLKLGMSAPAGVDLRFQTSQYNSGAGQNYDLLHMVSILSDENPEQEFTTGQSPRQQRDNLALTAIRGNIWWSVPRFDAVPTTGGIFHVWEGLLVWPWQTSGGALAAGTLSQLDPVTAYAMNNRWLWRRHTKVNILNGYASPYVGVQPGIIPGHLQEEIHIEPRVTLKENETLWWCVRHMVTQAENPQTFLLNTEALRTMRGWVDLRYLTWAQRM